MQQLRKRWPAGLVTVIALIIVACSPAGSATTEAAADEPGTEEAAVSTLVMQQEGAVEGMAADDKLLAWVAPGVAPGRQGASAPGELVFFNQDGTMDRVLELPGGTTQVSACGNDATTPDGNFFAFMVATASGGVERATLYMMQNTNPQLHTIAEDINPISCVGSSPFRFSPGGARYAYIDWPSDANNADSPRGRLLIHNTGDNMQVGNFENVTDFVLTDDGAAFISFFYNENNQATEVGISVWDGSNDREVSTLLAEENCYYTSASVTPITGGEFAAVLGYRCTRGETQTQWQLYRVNPENRSAQVLASATAGGRYFGFSDTNALFSAPDGSSVFFTVPDGVSSQSVSIYASDLSETPPTQILDRFQIMPSVSDTAYDENNATAQISPDMRYLAVVENTANNDATLNVIDLSDPSLPPIRLSAGDRGDTISWMIFSADSNQLFYVAGGDAGRNNSLFVLNLATGSESRIARGRYAQAALSQDASLIAVMQWFVYDDEEAPYLTLEVMDVNTTAASTIFVGGELDAEGELINQRFAYPLSWRSVPDTEE